jgi:putative ABC transport system permease protein
MFFRRVLVVFQFVLSLLLIIGTIVMITQLNFIRNKNLGFNKDQIMVIPFPGWERVKQFKVLKTELQNCSVVKKVTVSSQLPDNIESMSNFVWEGCNDNDGIMVNKIYINEDFLEIYDINILEGRNLINSNYYSENKENQEKYLINEAAAEKYGWDKVLYKRFGSGRVFNGILVGIVGDFHFKSLHDKIDPLVLCLSNDFYGDMSIKLNTSDFAHAVSVIKNKFNEVFPNKPFEYFFFDQEFDKMYKKETNLTKLITLFTSLSIIIACLGLFGLVSFILENKTKEIGVRKILGASVLNIVYLHTKEFLLLVIISNILCYPIGYYLMNKWLEDFAYRVEINWSVFMIGLGITILVTIITILFQTIKAAITDPVKSLRYE